ncbi:MAG: CRISPR-associated CARF protein Csa3 [Candidatus Bathyarchaeia archaeon]
MNAGKSPKSFLITLGWTEGPALTALTKHGLAEGDRIILLVPEFRDEGALSAISNLRAIVNKISDKIEVEELQIPLSRFEEAVATILRRLGKDVAKGRRLIVNLSGGMRILIVEALIATMLLGAEDVHLEIQSEDRKITINIPCLWEYTSPLSRPQKEILNNLVKRHMAISELAEISGLPISTTYRLVMELERGGLVKTEKVGRERVARPTMKGRLIANVDVER